jgi:hypothetical protein
MNPFTRIWNALSRRLGVLSLSCKEATRLQSEELDRRLGPAQRAGLRIHLLLCKWCRRYGRQIAFLHTIAPQQAEHLECLPSQPLPREARDRIKQRLRAEEIK